MVLRRQTLKISIVFCADFNLPYKCTYRHLETPKQLPETLHRLTWMREGPSVHQAIAHWPSP